MLSTKSDQPCPFLKDLGSDSAFMRALGGPGRRDQTILCTPLSDSTWSWPLRVSMGTASDSAAKEYFVKVAESELGMSMLRGEYESMSLLHSLVPDHAVEPIACGTCSSDPNYSFYISRFHDFLSGPPDVAAFCAMVASFHTKSADLFERGEIRPPPRGRFGFHVTTHMGKFPQDNGWADSWEMFFARGLRKILASEAEIQGRSQELDALAAQLLERVIPRLLRPMETQGRSIRPTLIHGDLQIRNVKTDKETHRPMVFDAGSFWGHNECDLGKWRLKRFSLGPQCADEYHALVPKSEPVDDWEDRHILYSIRYNLLSSAHYAGNLAPRQEAVHDMRYLVERYPNSYARE